MSSHESVDASTTVHESLLAGISVQTFVSGVISTHSSPTMYPLPVIVAFATIDAIPFAVTVAVALTLASASMLADTMYSKVPAAVTVADELIDALPINNRPPLADTVAAELIAAVPKIE
jgi:hypothetical protein